MANYLVFNTRQCIIEFIVKYIEFEVKLMNRRNTLITLLLSFVAGFLTKSVLDERNLSPEKTLEIAKETFNKSGPISGSWIYMTPETLEKNGLNYAVYRGGITRHIDGKNVEAVFFADVNTGAIIEVENFN